MHASYPNKRTPIHWDRLNLEYPKEPIQEEKNYSRNYNITNELTRSQTALHYGVKQPERERYSKNTSCTENLYIYPPPRTLTERPPSHKAHGITETQRSFVKQIIPSRLVTAKEHFLHPASLPLDPPSIEPFNKGIEPLDTTHEGFEKLLDPYLTTSRLHHRPFTAEQMNRISNTNDIMTYYTYSNTPWIRSPKPSIDKWRLPLSRPKSMYDKSKFKEVFREIRTHNKLQWTPSSFRTETRDNFKTVQSRPESEVYDFEDRIRNFYQSSIAHLQSNIPEEQSLIQANYCTENSTVGSRKPLCSVFDPYTEKNKRVVRKGL
ncbi:uncharacterized protein LOC123697585 [Colias croceus]|uniref:uncharacterized protein LOC123697585 n=1 Tax=Colias crocea TaxID=72248 RepID=UPI001E27AB26|nr:uncharacterized protein LOC123697585 [Colias croceus]